MSKTVIFASRHNAINAAVRLVFTVMLVQFLVACGVKAIVIEGEYPTPALRAIEANVGVYYTPDLKEFMFIEYTDEGDEEYAISSGQTHVELFDSILPGMFSSVTVLDDLDEASRAGVDIVFIPNIEEFQLGLPQKTRLGAYEVWLKYNMQLLSPNGDYIADWILTSYGRAPTESFQSVEAGVNEAAVGALRDLGSNFSLGFSSVPEVRDWLSEFQQ
ncbi:MAG: hypothetical protein R3332_06655 [Pseudohongiellaceae bacterium]|nr:hypothetical protein [Pseudohongiellaceae bacterium]